MFRFTILVYDNNTTVLQYTALYTVQYTMYTYDIFAPLLGAPGACGEREGILCEWNWIDWV